MDNQQTKIRIGIVCVGFFIATVALVLLFGGGKMPRLFSSDYEVYVILPHAPMLSENSPVYKNGVEIGRVTKVQLVDEDRKVEITAHINGKIKLYSNEECQLSLNLLGQSTLNFTPKPGEALGDVLAKKSTINGVTPIDLLKVADDLQSEVSHALRSISGAAEELTASFNKINQMIGTPEEVAKKQLRLEHMVDQAAKTMTAINSVLGSVDELINDPEVKAGIKASSTQLPDIIDEGKALMANVNKMTTQVATLLQRVDGTITKVDSNLDNMTKFTASLGDDGPQFVEALSTVAKEFEIAAAQLADFARSLNNPDGSLGQLLNDPEFFRSLNSTIKNADQTIKNIERITVQVQPILKDVNVFSNKIAREPGLLGLKGVFAKDPPTKNIPDVYAGQWGADRNGGIPQQQSERIQMIRTPRQKIWPFGEQQYRNEPVPKQNRYASQVFEQTDMSYYGEIYNDALPIGGYSEGPSMPQESFPIIQQGQPVAPPLPGRVVVVPRQNSHAAVQYTPALVEATWTRAASQSAQNGFVLEIDFETNDHSGPQPSPLRLATSPGPQMPLLTQPVQDRTQQTEFSPIMPVSGVLPVEKEKQMELVVPKFAPTY